MTGRAAANRATRVRQCADATATTRIVEAARMRRPRPGTTWTMLCLLVLLASCHVPVRAPSAWSQARQMILVVTPDWHASAGRLQRFERSAGHWHAVDAGSAVAIGRNGAAWGIGLHPPQPGLQKREGDGRSPAGVFALGTAFGAAPSLPFAWPYAPMSFDHWCIDVEGSAYYDRIVDARTVGSAAVAGSSEPMRRDLHLHGDPRYMLGVVVDDNPQHEQGAGSCIFLHLWRTPGEPTAGCTAMSNAAMNALLGWLQPEAAPVFVLLPRLEYQRLHRVWNLPDITPQDPP